MAEIAAVALGQIEPSFTVPEVSVIVKPEIVGGEVIETVEVTAVLEQVPSEYVTDLIPAVVTFIEAVVAPVDHK